MNSTKPLGWGVIGTSDIARTRMLEAINTQPDSRVVAVMSSSAERARQYADETGISRAYDSLVDLGVVESRRAMGMFVADGGRAKLLAHERDTFLREDWPRIRGQIQTLGLDLETLLKDSGK